jgi:hypothetical protein
VIFTFLVKNFTLAITRCQQNPRLAITFFQLLAPARVLGKMWWRVTLASADGELMRIISAFASFISTLILV